MGTGEEQCFKPSHFRVLQHLPEPRALWEILHYIFLNTLETVFTKFSHSYSQVFNTRGTDPGDAASFHCPKTRLLSEELL